MKKYILASTSPRRQHLLKLILADFEIIKPQFEEDITKKYFKYELVEKTAENKGLSVASLINYPSVIISADTVVVCNNIILGKPRDFDDALRMLTKLNGNTHKVVTSICVIDNEKNKKIIKSETSEVTFDDINIDDIKKYIFDSKPYDKAGAYGIQELPPYFIKDINGDYNNIVGLPLNLLKKMIDEINLV